MKPPELAEDAPPGVDPMKYAALRGALAALPRRTRLIAGLRLLPKPLTHKEIGALLSLSRSSVQQYEWKSVRVLAEAFSGDPRICWTTEHPDRVGTLRPVFAVALLVDAELGAGRPG